MMRTYVRSRLDPDGEHGATVVIVVLCLVAMIGVMVLTVDVGGLLLRRRVMVNAADSSALAAAQTCANVKDTQVPETVADRYAGLNGASIQPQNGGIIADPGCHDPSVSNSYVTVQYQTEQPLFFAGVLGFGGQSPVTTQATAAWGPPARAGILPIMLDSGQLQGQCDVPDGIQKDQTCPFFYDNDPSDLGQAQWGLLNLHYWGVQPNFQCSDSKTSDLKDWITSPDGINVTLNGTPAGSAPTYVCGNNGHVAGDWNKELSDQIGLIKTFPVNDCSGQLPAPCPSAPDKYDIIGFTKLLIKDVITGQAAKGTAGANGSCTWTHDFLSASTTQLSDSYGANATCPASKPDSILNLQIAAGGRNGAVQQPCTTLTPVPAPLGCMYFFDTTQNTITWVGLPLLGAKVTYDWSFNGTGPCGYHPDAGGNAVCLITQWKGFTTDTGGVCTTCPSFGLTNILLCDRTLKTCPGQ
jgi:hypothetical protein